MGPFGCSVAPEELVARAGPEVRGRPTAACAPARRVGYWHGQRGLGEGTGLALASVSRDRLVAGRNGGANVGVSQEVRQRTLSALSALGWQKLEGQAVAAFRLTSSSVEPS